MPNDRTNQNAPEQEEPTLSGAVRALRPEEMQRTLAVRLVPTVDKIRNLATKFGVRPYRVFIVHIAWTGQRIGQGQPQEISRREILPTPRVREMTSTTEVISTFGRLEEGAISIDQISASFAEDDLLGKTPDMVDPAMPRGGLHNREFFWEVQENRGVYPAPIPRRYAVSGVPTLSRGGVSWRVSLTKVSVDRSRQQTMSRTEA